MGKFSNLLLISDMDGTLFADPQTIPSSNLEAISYFVNNGGRFSIATGRSQISVRSYLDRLPINCPIITTNGAQIYDFSQNQRLFSYTCNENLRRAAVATQRQYPDVSCFILSGDIMYSPAVCPYHEIAERIECIKSTMVDSPEKIRQPWNKVLFFGDEDRVNAIYANIKNMHDDTFDVVMSAKYIVEMLPKNVNKGTTLTKLCELIGQPIANVCAIGDYFNDVAMLAAAGLSAAPLNAPQEIRDAVDYVCCDHTEGAVADFISYIEKNLSRFSSQG